jgi:hypothetical protein
MILSHSKQFIFVHNYKVAGTSIQDALNKYGNRSFLRSSLSDKVALLSGRYPRIYSGQFQGHIRAFELKASLPKEIFDNYYKFGFVRNPWDWQVSLYTFMRGLESHHQHKLIKSLKDFDEYIEWRVNNDLNLQKDFFYDGETCLVDYIGRMENLNHDFKIVLDRLGVHSTLPHLNKSRKSNDFLKYYSQKSIDIVNEAFKRDVELFGYTKPTLSPDHQMA